VIQITSSATPLSPGQVKFISAECPEGTIATGGGYTVFATTQGSALPIISSSNAINTNTAWEVQIANSGTASLNVFAKVECASLSPS
jgi:hypothetical protein